MRQPPIPRSFPSLDQRPHYRFQALQGGTQLGAEGHPRRVGHRPRLQVDRPPRGLVGARQDVLDRLHLGLLGQGQDLGFERGQLIGQSAVGIRKRLARLVQPRRQGLHLSDQLGGLPEGFDDQRFPRRARRLHDAGIAASPDCWVRRCRSSAAKHASSSGMTPRARRWVASRCARASLSD